MTVTCTLETKTIVSQKKVISLSEFD